MARQTAVHTSFQTVITESLNFSSPISFKRLTMMLFGGHGRSSGSNAREDENLPSTGPMMVDNSPGTKASIVVAVYVASQSSFARRPWKLTYIEGDVLR